MGRPRLSPEEKERRRKARSAFSFSDAAYHHYDARQGHGSTAEWRSAVQELLGDVADIPLPAGNSVRMEAARTKADFLAAFRAEIKLAHPDCGGSDALARAVLERYNRLKHKWS